MKFIIIPYSDNMLSAQSINKPQHALALAEYTELECKEDNPFGPGYEYAWTETNFFKVTVKVKRILAYTGVHDPSTNINYIRTDGELTFYAIPEMVEKFILEADTDEAALLWWEMLDKRTN